MHCGVFPLRQPEEQVCEVLHEGSSNRYQAVQEHRVT